MSGPLDILRKNAPYVNLERQIKIDEGRSIWGRWEFGRQLLTERKANGGKQLPHGRLDEVAKVTRTHPRELHRRIRFAEQFPTKEKVRHVCRTYGSWHDICDQALPAEPREKSERDPMEVHYSSATDEWETPQDLFDELDAEFHFDLDVCALPESAKCKRFFSPEDDGLAQGWTGTCWMNPPYGSEIGEWVEKARKSAGNGKATVVCLLPARVDTGWWWDNCRHGEVRFLRGRLKFGGGENAAPFPSAVVVFAPSVPAKTVYWELVPVVSLFDPWAVAPREKQT